MTAPHYPAGPTSPVPAVNKNGLGVSALVLGIIGAVFAFIPIIGVIAWPLVILGLIFGILGIMRARAGKANNQGVAIAGTACSAAGLVICFIWAVALGASGGYQPPPPAPVGNAGQGGSGADAQLVTPPATQESSNTAKVVYQATSTSGEAHVTYSAGGATDIVQEDVDSGWTKEVAAEKFLGSPVSHITVSAPFDTATMNQDSTVTCKVTVDGTVVSEQTASGQFPSATCSPQ